MIKIPKNYISPKVKIINSNIEGGGMFATSTIKKKEVVVVWGGTWGIDYTDKNGAENARKEGKLVMHWDHGLYSVEVRGQDPTYFINHSCDSNLWMKDAFTLVARTDIKKGEELTADYALWEANENHVMKWECKCGSPFCRKRITGKDWRLKNLQGRYKGHFSPLINKRVSKVNE